MQHLKSDNWIALGILVAMVSAAILVVYMPQDRKLDELREQIVTQRNQLGEDVEKTAVIPVMVQQIDTMKQRYKGFDRRLPKQRELALFLREISSILASQELSNQLTEPGNPTQEELFYTLPIIMKFRGPYLSLASLLKRIDGMERLTRIQKLSIATDKKGKDLNIELQMNIYFKEG